MLTYTLGSPSKSKLEPDTTLKRGLNGSQKVTVVNFLIDVQ